MSGSKVAKNYIYNLIYQLLIVVVPLITTPYLSRVLGASNIGRFSYTQSITTYFILFGTIGSALYGQREIAYVQSNKRSRTNVFSEIVLLRFITVSISLVIYWKMFIVNEKYKILFAILCIQIIASVFDISWFFQGMEEFKLIVFRNMIIRLLGVVLLFIFVKTKNDLYIYALTYCIPLIAGNLSLWLYLPKFVDLPTFRELNLVRHISPMLILFLPQISTQIYNVLDKTMIGQLASGISEVGYYEQSQKIIKIAITLVTSVGTVVMPYMAAAIGQGQYKKITDSIFKSFKFVFCLSFALSGGIIAISDKFVPWFFGNGFEKVSTLMIIFAPIIVVIGVSNVLGIQFLLPLKKQKEYTVSVTAGAIVNIVFNFILIPKMDSIGATIASLVAEIIVTVTQIIFVRKMLPIKSIMISALRYLLYAVIMGIIVFCVGIGKASSVITTISQIVLGGGIYILLLYVAKDEMLAYGISMFSRIRIGKKNE